MDPTLIVGTINAALGIVEQFMPELLILIGKGQVSVEQQAVIVARLDLIRSGKFFNTPQWQVSSATPPPAITP